MKVDGIHGLGGVSPSEERSVPAAQKPEVRSDATEFHRINAIEKALTETPAVRPEAVDRGLEMFNDVQYPPIPVINGLAKLLAERIGKDS